MSEFSKIHSFRDVLIQDTRLGSPGVNAVLPDRKYWTGWSFMDNADMLRPLLYLAIFCAAGNVNAQSCRIEPIGKPVSTYTEGGRALDAVIRPSSATDDANGNIYIYDGLSKRILRLAPDGTIHTMAGTGQEGSDGDGGQATQARISVRALTATPDGIIYFADQSRIRRIDRSGIIQTVAGTGRSAFNFDSGPALSIYLNGPRGLYYGKDHHLYFADQWNHRIRKLTPDGRIITLAGSNRSAGKWVDGSYGDDPDEGDGRPATQAYVPSPSSVFLLPGGEIVFGDYRLTPNSSWRVRVVDGKGDIRTIYSARNDINLQVDAQGNIYVTSFLNGMAIRKQILLNGDVVIPADGQDIPLPENSFNWLSASSYTLLPSGNVFQLRWSITEGSSSISDLSVNQIWIRESNRFRHVAGKGLKLPPIQDGPVSSASFPTPAAVNFDQNGGFYFLDRTKKLIYHVNAQQQIRKIFGGGSETGDPDGKHPLNVQRDVLGIAVSGPNELVIAMPVLNSSGTWERAIRLYRITPEKITSIRSANNEEITIRLWGETPFGKFVSVGADGTIYVLLKNALVTDVKTIDSKNSLHGYTLNGSYYPIRMEDGRVIAASSSQFNHIQNFYIYNLTPSGAGGRIRGLEGTSTTHIAQIGADAYIQASGYGFLFKKSIRSNQWKKILLDHALSDFSTPSQFLGYGWKNSLVFTTTSDINLAGVADLDSCPFISSPEVNEDSLVNSANYARPGVVSPGQLFTFWGKHLGPAEGEGITQSPGVGVSYPLGGTSIRFRYDCNSNLCDSPAQLIFGNDSQANLQMAITSSPLKEKPFEAYLYWENVYIPYPGTVKFASTNPGLFVINGGRDGQGAILNQNASINSITNPAAQGSVVSLYGTGLGEYDWSFVTGTVIPYEFLIRLKANITVRIGGKHAEVLYAGGSPGAIFGLNQINVRIPEGVSGPEVEVELDADGVSTSGTQRVTLAVQ